MADVVVPILAAAGGLAGIGALVNSLYRARSGRHVDEAEAADKTVSAAVDVVTMLRDEIREARADVIECRASAVRAELEARAAKVATELCEQGRSDDRIHLAQQFAQISLLADRLETVETMIGTLPRRRGDHAAPG